MHRVFRNESDSVRTINRTAGILAALVLIDAVAIGMRSWVEERADIGRSLATVAELEARAINAYFADLEGDLKDLGETLAATGDPVDSARAYELVRHFAQRHAELFNVTLVEPDGTVLLTAKNPPGSVHATLAAEPSFVAYLEDLKQGSTAVGIGQPLLSVVSKVAIVPVRYGARDRDGRLRFIVSANLPHEYLRTFWMDAPITAEASVGLMRDNGYLLSRYPVRTAIDLEQIYGKPRTGALIEHLRKAGFPASGQVTGASSTDGVDVVFAFRRLPSYPVTLFVALPVSAMRKTWFDHIGATYLALFLLILAGAAAYRIAVRSQAALEDDRRRLDQVREEAYGRLQKIASRVPGVVYQYLLRPDGSSCFPFASEAMRDIYRVSPDDVREDASKVFGNLHPDDYAGIVDSIQRSARDLTPWVHEYRVRFDDGTVRWLAGNATPEREPDGTVLWHGFITDITARRTVEAELARHREHLEELVESRTAALSVAKEAAEAASRAKTTFLATMSHELRTPMNAIMGMTALALDRATDPKQIDYLGKVDAAARQLLTLITDILDISRIEAEKLRLQQIDFDLHEVVQSVETMIRPLAETKQIELVLDLTDEIRGRVLRGDPQRLRQVLLNLVGNAVKFTDAGSVRLSVGVVADLGAEVDLRFAVRDTGIGIAVEDQPRLFRAFEQVDGSSTRRHGGTGLGLAISKRLVEMMGGEIGVDSRSGAGSTFWFTVRLARRG